MNAKREPTNTRQKVSLVVREQQKSTASQTQPSLIGQLEDDTKTTYRYMRVYVYIYVSEREI